MKKKKKQLKKILKKYWLIKQKVDQGTYRFEMVTDRSKIKQTKPMLRKITMNQSVTQAARKKIRV